MDFTAYIKPSRLLKLFAIVFGGIFILILLAGLIYLYSDTISAWTWHVRHGDKVTFAGVTFDVPFNAAPTINQNGTHLEMFEIHVIRGGLLSLDAHADGPALSDSQILQQQQRLVDFTSTHGALLPTTTETIHGLHLTYLCLRQDIRIANFGSLAETLQCRVPDTNLTVSTDAAPGDAIRARMLLYTASPSR